LYFPQFEGGAAALSEKGKLAAALVAQYGTLEMVVAHLKRVAMMRGPGWSILYFDPEAHMFHIGFSGEQHQGHFVTLPIVLAIDVWEHAYLLDYGAAGKAKYVDAFFENLNWEVIDTRFSPLA
jgi:Fe-Mn family superoxide dismutase